MSKRIKELNAVDELLEKALVPSEDELYEIPNNWSWVQLGLILEKIQYGYTEKATFDKVGPHFLRITDLNENGVNWGEVPYCKINDKDKEKFLLNNNDIVVARMGSVGKSYILKDPEESVFASYLIRLVLKEKISPDYIAHFMRSNFYWAQISTQSKGTTRPNANANVFREMNIPLPPKNEQTRIADKVERLLNKVDEAKQLIVEAKETFELRRAAILGKAFRGELTESWRKKNQDIETPQQRYKLIKEERYLVVENKRELSEINTLFDESDIDIDKNGWIYLKANMFCYNINCGGTPSKDISDKGEVPFLKVYNIVNNKVSFSYKPQFIPRSVHESKLKKSMLRSNDVIMNIVGPPLKKIAIIPDKYPEMNMNQAIVRFRPIKYVLPEYLFYCLQYDETLKEVINETRGVVGQSNISVSQSRNLVMPIPSLMEQHEIVKSVKFLLEKEDRVYQSINDSKNLEMLKQSILSKAFRGELGTNDPTEENAIELLKEVLQE